MTTLRQVAANRENALHSTGPRTEEGKETSRRNALRHGMAGMGVVMPEEEEDLARERMEYWLPYLRVQSHQEAWIAELMVIESVRVECARRHEMMVRRYESARARHAWDDDRRLEAEELLLRLAKQPTTVSRMLRRTPQGCDALIERWEALGRALEAKGMLDENECALGHDLLGTPTYLRTIERPFDTCEQARATIETALAGLQADRATHLAELDMLERFAAETGCSVEPSRRLLLVRRYLETSLRRFTWAHRLLEPANPRVPASTRAGRSPRISPPEPLPTPLTTPPAAPAATSPAALASQPAIPQAPDPVAPNNDPPAARINTTLTDPTAQPPIPPPKDLRGHALLEWTVAESAKSGTLPLA